MLLLHDDANLAVCDIAIPPLSVRPKHWTDTYGVCACANGMLRMLLLSLIPLSDAPAPAIVATARCN